MFSLKDGGKRTVNIQCTYKTCMTCTYNMLNPESNGNYWSGCIFIPLNWQITEARNKMIGGTRGCADIWLFYLMLLSPFPLLADHVVLIICLPCLDDWYLSITWKATSLLQWFSNPHEGMHASTGNGSLGVTVNVLGWWFKVWSWENMSFSRASSVVGWQNWQNPKVSWFNGVRLELFIYWTWFEIIF